MQTWNYFKRQIGFWLWDFSMTIFFRQHFTQIFNEKLVTLCQIIAHPIVLAKRMLLTCNHQILRKVLKRYLTLKFTQSARNSNAIIWLSLFRFKTHRLYAQTTWISGTWIWPLSSLDFLLDVSEFLKQFGFQILLVVILLNASICWDHVFHVDFLVTDQVACQPYTWTFIVILFWKDLWNALWYIWIISFWYSAHHLAWIKIIGIQQKWWIIKWT